MSNELTNTLATLFKRDLNRLKNEINAYQDESCIWKVDAEITNTAGNLCLHLTGNLNAFIGAELGNTGYIRKREDEFGLKDVPRSTLIKKVEDTIEMIKEVLGKMSDEDLNQTYPKEVFGKAMSTQFFLIHLSTHLGYHLGQVNYHRRLLDK